MALMDLLLPGCNTPGARHPDEERADKLAKSRGVHYISTDIKLCGIKAESREGNKGAASFRGVLVEGDCSQAELCRNGPDLLTVQTVMSSLYVTTALIIVPPYCTLFIAHAAILPLSWALRRVFIRKAHISAPHRIIPSVTKLSLVDLEWY